MDQPAGKPAMMRFEPESGWQEAGEPVAISDDTIKSDDRQTSSDQQLSAEALIELGESIQDVFNSLKINDPRLQVWAQVHATIRLIGGKMQEKKSLEARIEELRAEIEGVRTLASELVVGAYKNEQEVNAASTLRLHIAESFNEKLMRVLKN